MTRVIPWVVAVCTVAVPARAQEPSPFTIPAKFSVRPPQPAEETPAAALAPEEFVVACDQLYTSDVSRPPLTAQEAQAPRAERDQTRRRKILEALTPVLQRLNEQRAALGKFAEAALPNASRWPPCIGDCSQVNAGATPPELARSQAHWLVGACADMLGYVRQHTATLEGVTGHRLLAGQHLSLRSLRRWQRALGDASVTLDHYRGAAEIRVRAAKDALEDVLRAHELFNLFSASLFTGGVIADAEQVEAPAADDGDEGGDASTANGSSVEDTQTYLTNLTIETAHYGWDSNMRFEASLRAKLGLQPALTLVQRQAASGEEPAGEEDDAAPLIAQNQQAFAWSIGPHVHSRLSEINAEWGGFLKIGATHLLSDVTLVDRGEDRSFVAFPVGQNDRTAWLFETGAEFSLFDNPLTLIHLEKTPPQFTISAGYRRDSRFLPDGPLVTFDSPQHRFFFRFMFDALKVIDRRKTGELPRPLDFGFGIEYDRAFFGLADPDQVPASTRIILRGNINLLRALRGRDEAAGDTADTGGNGQGGGNGGGSARRSGAR